VALYTNTLVTCHQRNEYTATWHNSGTQSQHKH